MARVIDMAPGGTTYAMPMYRRARFHPEWETYALHPRPNAYIERSQLFKAMLQAGYKPLITRAPLADDSPEMKLINTAPSPGFYLGERHGTVFAKCTESVTIARPRCNL